MIALEKDVRFVLIIQYKAFFMYIFIKIRTNTEVQKAKWTVKSRGQHEERQKKAEKNINKQLFFSFFFTLLCSLALSLTLKRTFRRG